MSLQTDLREVLNKYGFECCRISIILTHKKRDIMEIEIENLEEQVCKENKLMI